MSIKNRIISLSIGLLLSVLSTAQQTHSSPYSYIGVGDVYTSGLAYNRSLGGLGVGTRSSFYLNSINPAALSAMDTMSFTFEFGASGVYSILETPTVNEPSFNGSIDYMAIGFPITRWLKTSVGFMPFSKVGYNLTEQVEAMDGDENLFTLQRDIKGEGGINQLYLSNSVMFLKKFSLGLKLTYIFGQIKNTTTDSPQTSDPSISGYTEELTTRVSDVGYSFGLQYHDKINEKYKFTIGGIYGVENSLGTSTSVLMQSYSTGHPADTLFISDDIESSVNLPSFFGLGFSIGSEQIMIGFDYHYTAWSNVSIGNKTEEYLDAQRFIFGAEYIPKPRTATKYIHRMRYRLAGKYEKSYMQINKQQLKDVGITFGVGLPMKRSKSTLNISFDIGKRGSFQAEDALTQSYFKVNFDLSLHDVWFIKRKFD